ncbi:myeloid-derived growth factor isoform X2 [Mirounga leonina]|uniref:myeloid-derived growth factor isoform X2 n=1 Tax=Mirounga leonina TaxID=9715 RepID=UPI00156C2F14|nr:myeloid-derived growth factor isoform X2 [Mirounga leonina]
MVIVHFPHSRRNLLHLLTGRAVGLVTGLGIAARTDSRTTHRRDSPRKSKPRPNMAAPGGRGRGASGHVAAPPPTWPLADAPRVPRRVPSPPQPCGPDPKMAAPSERRNGGGASLWAVLLLAAVALRPAEAVSEPTTVAFDVRPGGVVHSFSQNVGPGDKYTCAFTYASQGGTNELQASLLLQLVLPLWDEAKWWNVPRNGVSSEESPVPGRCPGGPVVAGAHSSEPEPLMHLLLR